MTERIDVVFAIIPSATSLPRGDEQLIQPRRVVRLAMAKKRSKKRVWGSTAHEIMHSKPLPLQRIWCRLPAHLSCDQNIEAFIKHHLGPPFGLTAF